MLWSDLWTVRLYYWTREDPSIPFDLAQADYSSPLQTIFAAGNSLSDFVANITIARAGYSLMAFSACFGGP